MAAPETNRQKIVTRLSKEGWVNAGGGSHDIYTHSTKPGVISLPRHRTLSPGVARSIAKIAGW